jgi:hypothetical protein
MFTGGFGAGGGMSLGKTLGNMGSAMSGNMGSIMKGLGGFGSSMGGGLSSILGMLGMFSEGGYSTEPVGARVMSMGAFHTRRTTPRVRTTLRAECPRSCTRTKR